MDVSEKRDVQQAEVVFERVEPERRAEPPVWDGSNGFDDRPPLDRRLLGTVIAVAVAAFAAVEFLTPATVDPGRDIDALSVLINATFFGGAFASACFLVDRRAALGYGCLAVAAWGLFVGVIACPATGHHDYGAWWAGQMAVGLAFAVVATAAAAISRRTSPPVDRSPG